MASTGRGWCCYLPLTLSHKTLQSFLSFWREVLRIEPLASWPLGISSATELHRTLKRNAGPFPAESHGHPSSMQASVDPRLAPSGFAQGDAIFISLCHV